ncbi:chromosome segregation protein smc [Fusarium austroafricanum]|uniref:Chromosome segregation protein smc n=1 Tax=Fusarium austroafricanum TaxID=2364996 RepID=A0A8H4P965_9HYPO|nr:chromosome segregation protein smc [Fusarium austroafricanum]
MEESNSPPGSPGGPLQAVTADRVNQQRERESVFSHLRGGSRDVSVHDKISQFNNLSVTLQSKQLERKTADAALKRAMLGREEAETELRRYREENKNLRKAIDEGKERERKVGERLESLMENYGRAKETHAHTQALWEKEIRRARKETFKTQSSIVKLQEELKSARTSAKMTDENLKREKARSKVREQEAFEARYQIVGVQEQLDQALERIKLIEQERDAYKTAAKNEEVARIAAEGRIPLPSQDADDEFASPQKDKSRVSRDPRVSLSTMDIVSSEASEAEIEELSIQLQWERQRADRAHEMVEFLQAECHLRCCACSKSNRRISVEAPRQKRRSSFGLEGPNDKVLKLDNEVVEAENRAATSPRIEEPQVQDEPEVRPEIRAEPEVQSVSVQEQCLQEPPQHVIKSRKEPRRSTIFCPKEGIFRTVSEQEAEIIEVQRKMEEAQATAKAQQEADAESEPHDVDEVVVEEQVEAETTLGDNTEMEPHYSGEDDHNYRRYARTPSVEPPAFAMLAQERTSLASLLNAPHGGAYTAPIPQVPTMPDVAEDVLVSPDTRPHTTNTFYTVTTTTTVPIHDDKVVNSASFNERLRTPSHNSTGTTFDMSNPALTPTMTREQALAKIRERRGRARSMAQGTMTPSRRMVEGVERRDMSAPTGKVAGKGR